MMSSCLASCIIEFRLVIEYELGEDPPATLILIDEIEAALATKPLCDMVLKYEVDQAASKVRYWLKHPRYAKKAERRLFAIPCFTE